MELGKWLMGLASAVRAEKRTPALDLVLPETVRAEIVARTRPRLADGRSDRLKHLLDARRRKRNDPRARGFFLDTPHRQLIKLQLL